MSELYEKHALPRKPGPALPRRVSIVFDRAAGTPSVTVAGPKVRCSKQLRKRKP